jgi:hypothetical protein
MSLYRLYSRAPDPRFWYAERTAHQNMERVRHGLSPWDHVCDAFSEFEGVALKWASTYVTRLFTDREAWCVEQYFARYRNIELLRDAVDTPVTLETLNLEHVLIPTDTHHTLDGMFSFEVSSRPALRAPIHLSEPPFKEF